MIPLLYTQMYQRLAGGAALTQVQHGIERALSFASHRWSVTDAKRAPTECEAAAVLWVVEHFRQVGSRLMEYDMDLKSREGRKHHLPDALSRLPRSDRPATDIDVSFPGESPTALTCRGPQGPILDGIPLKDMGVDEIDYRDNQDDSAPKRSIILAAIFNTELMDAELSALSLTAPRIVFRNWTTSSIMIQRLTRLILSHALLRKLRTWFLRSRDCQPPPFSPAGRRAYHGRRKESSPSRQRQTKIGEQPNAPGPT